MVRQLKPKGREHGVVKIQVTKSTNNNVCFTQFGENTARYGDNDVVLVYNDSGTVVVVSGYRSPEPT
jgi:hypothetical protein